MIRYIYSLCQICNTYKKIEVDDKMFNEMKNLRLIHRKSKIFVICKECLDKIKEVNKYE